MAQPSKLHMSKQASEVQLVFRAVLDSQGRLRAQVPRVAVIAKTLAKTAKQRILCARDSLKILYEIYDIHCERPMRACWLVVP